MQVAALGMTCKHALEILAANETLRLQADVTRLEAEVQTLKTQLHTLQRASVNNGAMHVTFSGMHSVCPYGLDMW